MEMGLVLRLAVVGLGYVGLPLAVAFARKHEVVGYDYDPDRIAALRQGKDTTGQVDAEALIKAKGLHLTDNSHELAKCTVFIVTVPTPVDVYKHPDFGPLIKASETVACYLKQGDVVIYESTVYPGATEEICVPILESRSGLKFNRDFFVGYSPERINPGDRNHRLENVVKITSGSTPEAADFVDQLYKEVVLAGTYKVSSIKIAEAAKVIENIQRDVNIALVNELAILFQRLGLDTGEVLAAARTKWNFLPFQPGLVGGHCIGVDPYYLTYKAQEVGYHPEVILAGRRINDGMGHYVAEQVVKLMVRHRINPVNANVLVMGLTFKENCPDLRNSKVIDLITTLKEYLINVSVHDPLADAQEAQRVYGLRLIESLRPNTYDAVVVAVAHRQYIEMGIDAIRALLKPGGVLYDVKHLFPKNAVDGRL